MSERHGSEACNDKRHESEDYNDELHEKAIRDKIRRLELELKENMDSTSKLNLNSKIYDEYENLYYSDFSTQEDIDNMKKYKAEMQELTSKVKEDKNLEESKKKCNDGIIKNAISLNSNIETNAYDGWSIEDIIAWKKMLATLPKKEKSNKKDKDDNER